MRQRDITKSSTLFGSLADPTRIRVLLAIWEKGEQRGVDLTRLLRMPQATVATHLRILLDHGLLCARREGLYVFYSVPRTQLEELREALERLLPA